MKTRCKLIDVEIEGDETSIRAGLAALAGLFGAVVGSTETPSSELSEAAELPSQVKLSRSLPSPASNGAPKAARKKPGRKPKGRPRKDPETVDAGVAYSPEERRRGPRMVLGEAVDRTAELAAKFAQAVAPNYQPLLIEQEFRIELPDASHDLVGILDLATDLHRVVNFKTSGKIIYQEDADHSPQLTIEAAGFKPLTGHTASEVRLDVIYNQQVVRHSVKRSTRGPLDFEALATRVNAMLLAITQGNYPPRNPAAGGFCSKARCGYFATCPYVAGGRE